MTETKLKARFLYYFATYVKWPKNAFPGDKAPFRITVVGGPDMVRELGRTLKTKRIHGRSVVVAGLVDTRSKQAPAILRRSHVVYVATPDKSSSLDVDRKIGDGPTLFLADDTTSLSRGAAIGFFVHKKKIRFEIAVTNLKRRGLSASVKLLRLARKKPRRKGVR